MVLDQTPMHERGRNFIQIGLGLRASGQEDTKNQYLYPQTNRVYPALPESKDSSHSMNGYPNVYPDNGHTPVTPPPPPPTPTPPIPKTPVKPVPVPTPQVNPAPVPDPSQKTSDNTSSSNPTTPTSSFFKKNKLVIVIVSIALLLAILTLIICCICYKRHRGPYNTVSYDDNDMTPTNRRSGLINN